MSRGRRTWPRKSLTHHRCPCNIEVNPRGRLFEVACGSIFFVQSAIRLRILATPMPNRPKRAVDEDRAKRRQMFELLAPRFGRIVPASFVQNPQLPGVDRVHHLIEGIYKPAWSNYPLSIASMLKSPTTTKPISIQTGRGG
jgi:hypothetical protein